MRDTYKPKKVYSKPIKNTVLGNVDTNIKSKQQIYTRKTKHKGRVMHDLGYY